MTKLIRSHAHDPYYNLALEEWAIRNLDTSQNNYLFLYTNTDCVVVGRNQNVFQEVNLRFCKQNNIAVCRRVSGGGTVFHDLQNLNWTFISKFEPNRVNNYHFFAEPILSVLKKLGLNPFLNDRNAIMVGNTKVSGQAQFTNRKNILSHGTLLINSNLEKLNESISLKNKKVHSKAPKSVRSKVKTLQDLLQTIIHPNEIANLIQKQCKANEEINLATAEIEKAINNYFEKYKKGSWIYERASKCTIQETINKHTYFFEIDKGKIVTVKNELGKELENSSFVNKDYLELI